MKLHEFVEDSGIAFVDLFQKFKVSLLDHLHPEELLLPRIKWQNSSARITLAKTFGTVQAAHFRTLPIITLIQKVRKNHSEAACQALWYSETNEQEHWP